MKFEIVCDVIQNEETFTKGEIVTEYTGNTYGCCTLDEIPVIKNGTSEFVGVDKMYLKK
jgi:hypothetical protein